MAEDKALEAAARPSRRQNLGGHLLLGAILLGGLALSLMLGQLDSARRISESRTQATAELATIRAQLEGQILATFSVTEGIVHLLRHDGTITQDHFAGMAAQAIAASPHIRNIGLAPDDVIRYIYPLAGNEKALGLDYRSRPEQYGMVKRARELNMPVLAGPVNLVQGGRGLIHRRPVFITRKEGGSYYWGSASMVADVDRLLAAGGINREAPLQLALRGLDGNGDSGAIIWGDPALFQQQPTTMSVQVPGGTWQLGGVPRGGWPDPTPYDSPLFLVALANTLLLAYFVAQLTRRNRLIRAHNTQLSREITERQVVQASLTQSESRFRSLFERSPDPTWIIRHGRFTDANQAALDMFGMKERGFSDLGPLDISPEFQPDGQASANKAKAMIDIALAKGMHRFEWQHRRLNGEIFPAEVTLCTMMLEGEVVLYAMIRDISERLRAEEALQRQQALLLAIVDNAPSLIYMFDADGRLQLCSRLFERAVGRSRQNIIGQGRETFLPPHIAVEHRQNDLAVMASGESMRFEERNLESGDLHIYLTTKTPLLDNEGRIQGVLGISTDITEIKKTGEELRLAGVVMENTADGVIITDTQGTILSVNRAFTEITGYSPMEALGQTPRLLRSDHQDADFYQQMWDSLGRDGIWRGEIWNRRKSGALYPEWLTINAVRDSAQQLTNYVAVFSDISAIKHSQAELERLAHFDPLTGLPNRTLFHDRLQHALERAQRYDQELAVLLLDLDGFKTVNDSLGHPVGDLLLQQAAQRFKECVRVEDTVSRLGGDEFAVILNNLGQGTDAILVVKKMLQALQEPFDLDGTAALVTASIGIAISPLDGHTPEELVRNADTAMYGAKEGGRNNYRFYQSDMTRKAQERLTQERALRRALEEGEFEVWYQPKLDLETGLLAGAEALLRWRDPQRGLVSPAEFIPLAERTGLIVPIGEQVLDLVCQQIRQWLDEGRAIGRIAVNVAALQIERSDYAETLRQALTRHQLPPSVLEVEVTESLIMESPQHAREVLCAIQELGVTTAVDDFGTGYSSLAYLKVLPINNLKIDRAFVSDLPHNSNDVAIARAIIALGHSLGFQITAEGIESTEQLDFLKNAGCDQGQGYLFARPMPAPEFTTWIGTYCQR